LEWPVRRRRGRRRLGSFRAKRFRAPAITSAASAWPCDQTVGRRKWLIRGEWWNRWRDGRYNWQTGPWVLGVEGDYSWANITGSSATCGFAPPHGCGAALESFGTLRGRFGYAMGYRGTWLPYVTGGLAVGELHAWDALTPASGSAFRAGWTIGAGIETVLAPNWTFKFEYLYMDLGSAHLFDIVPGIPETVSFRDNIFRIGINYKFWGPEPVRPLVTK